MALTREILPPDQEESSQSAVRPGNRFRLRKGVEKAHNKLDQSLAGLRLSELRDLELFYLAHAWWPGIEDWLTQNNAGEVFPDWPGLLRSRDLLHDYRTLGIVSPPVDEWPRRPLSGRRKARESALAGVAYVLVGARLGTPTLLSRLPGDLPFALQFLRRGVTLRCRPFFDRLDNLSLDTDVAIIWANDVFDLALSVATRNRELD